MYGSLLERTAREFLYKMGNGERVNDAHVNTLATLMDEKLRKMFNPLLIMLVVVTWLGINGSAYYVMAFINVADKTMPSDIWGSLAFSQHPWICLTLGLINAMSGLGWTVTTLWEKLKK